MFESAKQLVAARQAAAAADAELERTYKELAYCKLQFETNVEESLRERLIAAAMDSTKSDQIYDNASGKTEDQFCRAVGTCDRKHCGCPAVYQNIFSNERCCFACITLVCPPEVSELLKLEDPAKKPVDALLDCEWRTLGPDVDVNCRKCLCNVASHHFRGSAYVLCSKCFG